MLEAKRQLLISVGVIASVVSIVDGFEYRCCRKCV